MSASKQTAVVLALGAWHTPDHYAILGKRLIAAGYLFDAPHLPSSTANLPLPENASLAGDSEAYRKAVEKYVDEGHTVIGMFHSMGGMVGTNALKGLSWNERQAKGLAGGVTHLIYIAAFLMQVGGSITDLERKGHGVPTWQTLDLPAGRRFVEEQNAIDTFYHDYADQDHARELARMLLPHSLRPLTEPLEYTAFKDIPSTYIYCKGDRAIPLFLQQAMVEGAGVPLDSVTLEGGHSPFLYAPDAIVDITKRLQAQHAA